VIYFVTVFILATAITRLDFLQNLAVIVRGGKKVNLTNLQTIDELERNIIEKESIQYFDERSSLRPDEINQSSDGDLLHKFNRDYYYKNIDKELVGMSTGRSGISKMEMTLIAQDLALSHISRRYRMPVHRYVKIKDHSRVIELDGIIRYQDHDILLETFVYWVDWLSSFIIRKHIEQRISKIRRYREQIDRDIIFRVLIIGNFNEDFYLSFKKSKNKLRKKYADVSLSIEVLSFDDIGLKLT